MFKHKKFILLICGMMFISVPVVVAVELPSDPNNAALLYYQALLLCPEPDAVDMDLVYGAGEEQIFKALCGGVPEDYDNLEEKISKLEERLNNEELIREMEEKQKEWNKHRNGGILTSKMIQDHAEINHYLSEKNRYKDLKARQEKMRGYTPNEKMRKYLKECRQSIELAQAASEISECDWGIQYSQGLACTLPKPTELRQFLFILRADALLLAADGDFRSAFERCLMMRRFARHIGDDTVILYLLARAFDNSTLNCIQFLLGNMKQDIDTVTWLKNQLSIERKPDLSHARALRIDFGMALKSLHKQFSDVLRKQAEKNPENKTINLTDEDFIARGQWLYSNFLSSALQVIDSNMPYTEKYAELQRLTEKLKKDTGLDPGAMGLIMSCAGKVLNLYKIHVDNDAYINALKVAIELYLIRAETGKLPKDLPGGLPMDPYSGEDFEYELTEEGFILRCRVKPIDERQVRQYEFKIKK